MSESRGLVGRTLGRLRHPWLFAIAATALVTDLMVPDLVPFVDEILLMAATTGLGLLKKRRSDQAELPAEEAEQDAAADAAADAG